MTNKRRKEINRSMYFVNGRKSSMMTKSMFLNLVNPKKIFNAHHLAI